MGETGGLSKTGNKSSVLDYDRLLTLALAALFFASLAVTVFSMSLGDSPALIVGDGKGYYCWARSVILDGDVDFINDYRLIYPPDPLPVHMEVRTPRGLVPNAFSIGMAIIDTPGLLVAHCFTMLLFPQKANGISLPYQICVTWPLIALILFSFHYLYRAMVSLGAAKAWAFWFCITAIAGSNLIQYTAKETTMSHGAGVALMNIIIYLSCRYDAGKGRLAWKSMIPIGLLTGLLILVRNTNIIIVLLIAALAVLYFRFSVRDILSIAAVAFPVVLLQPLSLYLLWGEPRITPYYYAVFNDGVLGIARILFSLRHGLFTLNPWYAVLLVLSMIGLSVPGRLRSLSFWTVLSFAFISVINGLWSFSMREYCFGQRAFIEILPMFSIVGSLVASDRGFAQRSGRVLLAVMLFCIVLNIYLWAGYLIRAYPVDGSGSLSDVYLWIVRRFCH
jgi:hypothetical protein